MPARGLPLMAAVAEGEDEEPIALAQQEMDLADFVEEQLERLRVAGGAKGAKPDPRDVEQLRQDLTKQASREGRESVSRDIGNFLAGVPPGQAAAQQYSPPRRTTLSLKVPSPPPRSSSLRGQGPAPPVPGRSPAPPPRSSSLRGQGPPPAVPGRSPAPPPRSSSLGRHAQTSPGGTVRTRSSRLVKGAGGSLAFDTKLLDNAQGTPPKRSKKEEKRAQQSGPTDMDFPQDFGEGSASPNAD